MTFPRARANPGHSCAARVDTRRPGRGAPTRPAGQMQSLEVTDPLHSDVALATWLSSLTVRSSEAFDTPGGMGKPDPSQSLRVRMATTNLIAAAGAVTDAFAHHGPAGALRAPGTSPNWPAL